MRKAANEIKIEIMTNKASRHSRYLAASANPKAQSFSDGGVNSSKSNSFPNHLTNKQEINYNAVSLF
jgi:hypothetical protein